MEHACSNLAYWHVSDIRAAPTNVLVEAKAEAMRTLVEVAF
jgi:hypothetical protein